MVELGRPLLVQPVAGAFPANRPRRRVLELGALPRRHRTRVIRTRAEGQHRRLDPLEIRLGLGPHAELVIGQGEARHRLPHHTLVEGGDATGVEHRQVGRSRRAVERGSGEPERGGMPARRFERLDHAANLVRYFFREPVGRIDRDDRADERRVFDRERDNGCAAHRVADGDDRPRPELGEEGGEVVRVAARRVAVFADRTAAVAAQVRCDAAVAGRLERGSLPRPVRSVATPSMDEEHRGSFALVGVEHPDAVDLCVGHGAAPE